MQTIQCNRSCFQQRNSNKNIRANKSKKEWSSYNMLALHQWFESRVFQLSIKQLTNLKVIDELFKNMFSYAK